MSTIMFPVSVSTLNRIHLFTSVIGGLQMVAAASVFGDFVGARYAALAIVVLAATQQILAQYGSRLVLKVVERAEATAQTATEALDSAHEALDTAHAYTTAKKKV